VALALSGLALIAPWREGALQSLAGAHPAARLVAILLVAGPAGFPFGVTDAYLAHNLYSNNTPTARVDCPRGCRPGQQPEEAWRAFNVPFPPEHRLFEQAFRLTCRPGDRLRITDSRGWFRSRGLGERRLACPPGGQATRPGEGQPRDRAGVPAAPRPAGQPLMPLLRSAGV
jgi:hypothetical protein